MKFSNIVISNFRQYYGEVGIDLPTQGDQNIILFGGKNGFGKTNFLLSIVWCLYGDKLSQIDDNFKKEIQKEKNYSSFMQRSLNWTAERAGEKVFSVSITVTDIDLPDLEQLKGDSGDIIITRTFNIVSMRESLSITGGNSNKELFDDELDKFHFINDYIIPIDAAKFVFFDAEKISEIANLSIKDEGSFINDALSKVLGLDVYVTLVDDLEDYINNLKKQGATKSLQEQIVNKENAINLSRLDIKALEEENADIQKKIDTLRKDIREYDKNISQHSKQGASNFDRQALVVQIEKLRKKEANLAQKFKELSEVIPFVILTGKLEEVSEHLKIQEEHESAQSLSRENLERVEKFIDQLFNKPPDPEDTTMTFKDKAFYFEKAMQLSQELFNSEGDDYQEIDFEHDLSKAEKQLIANTLEYVNSQSGDLFEITIQQYNEVQNSLADLTKKLSKVDADLEDELVLEYVANKEDAEYKISESNKKIGQNSQKIARLNSDVLRHQQQVTTLMKKVELDAQNRLKMEESQKYIDVLNAFLEEQKENHKNSLEWTILSELKSLMHKLSSEGNQGQFIEGVSVTILASGQGMKVTLLDQDSNEIRKESLSSGEKQIYISCLIKAILSEAIQSLPIFIDTPLGRLDEEHRDSITKKYYPALSEQVVLFSTNSEITPKRYKEIEHSICKSYLLVNDGVNTTIEPGYFKYSSHD